VQFPCYVNGKPVSPEATGLSDEPFLHCRQRFGHRTKMAENGLFSLRALAPCS
jgi:hypothetical protein